MKGILEKCRQEVQAAKQLFPAKGDAGALCARWWSKIRVKTGERTPFAIMLLSLAVRHLYRLRALSLSELLPWLSEEIVLGE